MKLGIFANQDFVTTVNEFIEIELPAKISYKISKIHQELAVENEKFELAKREILLKHAEKDEDGEYEKDENGNIKILNEDLEKLNTDLNELSNTEFTVGLIRIEELGDINIPPRFLSLLSDIIVG